MAENTMLVRRGDVVHVRGCERTRGANVVPVIHPSEDMRFCSHCGATPTPKVMAGALNAGVYGKTVSVPESGLDAPFEGRVIALHHEGSITGRTVTTFTFEPLLGGRAHVITVDSTVRVEVQR
ncbi:hypothetical protein [Curtobacterium sp. MCBD17_008]|uniref:hypothetical protein n=1 Tax=Curtobacterium sp. MCBD17_008 TaxID=2175656 RepID=UPI000DA97B82|nr:hypothetical protein [Curtobacterium sp. MCBD17_008]PZE89966.1 hypothetical protein DEI95_13170 [Curtobacterium sp. MCBD17_008]